MRTAVRYRRLLAALAVALVAAVLLGVAVGAVWVSPASTLRLAAWKLGLIDRPEDVTHAAEVIVLQLR